MTALEIVGTVSKFSVSEPKQEDTANAKPKQINTRLRVAAPDSAVLSGFCSKPQKAKAAMDAVLKAGGRVEFPCDGEECFIKYALGDAQDVKHQTDKAVFSKIVLDARSDGCEAHLSYTEPFDLETGNFHLRTLGVGHRLLIEPAQTEMNLKK